MQRRLRWIHWLLLLLALAVVATGLTYLASYDWSRSHRNAAAALPPLNADIAAGLVSIPAGGMQFRARVALSEAPVAGNVILLHGFPESSIMWQPLINALASRKYRVIAFDQRGYSPGARPDGVQAYALDALMQDVLDVADAAGFEQFHLVGHDWGAVVAWTTAMHHPERVQTLSAMAIPHPAVFFEAVLNDPEQSQRSGYFEFFRKPYLPEALFVFANQRRLKQMLSRLPQSHVDEYQGILSEPGAMTSALNWYRAMDLEAMASSDHLQRKITQPTLFLSGNADGLVARKLYSQQREWVDGSFTHLDLDAGHALIQYQPEAVVSAITGHIASH
ncbi:MAG: alpha/beta hydrolase [Pseudomonadota bacterium]